MNETIIKPTSDLVPGSPPIGMNDFTRAPFERLPDGLVKGVLYPRRLDGRIDWVKLIKLEHIIFNSSEKMASAILGAYGAPANQLVYADVVAQGKEVDPRHILVLLLGFIELADLRGYLDCVSHLTPVSENMVSCSCAITWDRNPEEPNGKTSTGEADATMDNTGGFGYLSAMAGNRAFVRAVKRGLRIPILGFDEIAKKDTPVPETVSAPTTTFSSSPAPLLEKAANDNKNEKGEPAPLDFGKVREAAIFHWTKLQADTAHRPKIEGDPNQWSKWTDISARDCLTLIKAIKDKAKKKP